MKYFVFAAVCLTALAAVKAAEDESAEAGIPAQVAESYEKPRKDPLAKCFKKSLLHSKLSKKDAAVVSSHYLS